MGQKLQVLYLKKQLEIRIANEVNLSDIIKLVKYKLGFDSHIERLKDISNEKIVVNSKLNSRKFNELLESVSYEALEIALNLKNLPYKKKEMIRHEMTRRLRSGNNEKEHLSF